jgi:hypothetical protein
MALKFFTTGYIIFEGLILMVDGKIRVLINCISKFYNFPGEKISLLETLTAPEEKIVTKL